MAIEGENKMHVEEDDWTTVSKKTRAPKDVKVEEGYRRPIEYRGYGNDGQKNQANRSQNGFRRDRNGPSTPRTHVGKFAKNNDNKSDQTNLEPKPTAVPEKKFIDAPAPKPINRPWVDMIRAGQPEPVKAPEPKVEVAPERPAPKEEAVQEVKQVERKEEEEEVPVVSVPTMVESSTKASSETQPMSREEEKRAKDEFEGWMTVEKKQRAPKVVEQPKVVQEPRQQNFRNGNRPNGNHKANGKNAQYRKPEFDKKDVKPANLSKK